MIAEVNNIIQVPEVMRLAKNIDGVPIDKLKDLIVNAITKKSHKILISKKDGVANGVIFATVDEFDGDDVVFIQVCYINKDAKYAGKEMISIINKWAKEKNIESIVMMTDRNPEAYERKYQFKLCSYVMKRSVI